MVEDIPKHATNRQLLLAQLLSPATAKTEREYAAVREIERLKTALHSISLWSQNSTCTKEGLGALARQALV